MKKFLLQFFTWWNGQTLGTRLHTWRYGKQCRPGRIRQRLLRGRHGFEGRTRRWVIYNGVSGSLDDPARLARLDAPPRRYRRRPKEDYKPREWQKPHQPNLTGTRGRLPAEGLGADATRSGRSVTGDYDAWTPGN